MINSTVIVLGRKYDVVWKPRTSNRAPLIDTVYRHDTYDVLPEWRSNISAFEKALAKILPKQPTRKTK